MSKIGWLAIIIFVGVCLYTLMSVFAPTGEVDTVSGLVLDVTPNQIWIAGTQGWTRVITTDGAKCTSLPAGLAKVGDWVEVRAKVTDSFQMSVCDAVDGYIKANDHVYPKHINEPES